MRAVYLTKTGLGRRAVDTGRAYSLSDPDMPKGATIAGIIAWLNVEKSPRYQPNDEHTYCNIYAHDVCFVAGVFLPRVWWMSPASVTDATAIVYAKTVSELNANALLPWLQLYGAAFGWEPVSSPEAGQQLANEGRVVVISAARVDPSRSGHIAVIAPESATVKFTNGIPVQSQAGRRNYSASCAPGSWWKGSQFRAFGIWSNKAVQQ